ncbi:hypothetical protein HanPSC8_Chr17g0798661 [Helianthus annuus]|nr:hypothetical protein HanPSC8_Chr17g0798661 [Helianthus annuus]
MNLHLQKLEVKTLSSVTSPVFPPGLKTLVSLHAIHRKPICAIRKSEPFKRRRSNTHGSKTSSKGLIIIVFLTFSKEIYKKYSSVTVYL